MTLNELAGCYDRWYDSSVGAAVDRMEKRAFVPLLKPKPGERLLEVGSGTGHWALWFRSLGLNVTGLEMASGMLAAACKKAGRDPNTEGIHYVRGDARHLPLREGWFDVATAVTTLEFIPQVLTVLDEMWRCTRVGGRLVVGALNARSCFARQRRRKAEHQDTVFSKAHFFQLGELRGLLGRYGSASVATSTYLHPSALGAKLAPTCEVLGKILFTQGGAFLVGRVDKKASN